MVSYNYCKKMKIKIINKLCIFTSTMTSTKKVNVNVYEITISATGAELQFLNKEDAHRSMGLCLSSGLDFSFMVRDTKVGSKSHKRIIEWNRQFSTFLITDPIEARMKIDEQMVDCPVEKLKVHIMDDLPQEKVNVSEEPKVENQNNETSVSTVEQIIPLQKKQKTTKSKEICSMIVKNGKSKNTPCTHFCIKGTTLCGYHSK